jgi:16S rRNA (guanine966-N2)-methyltransferase
MRVIGGEFRSRRLKSIPGAATRPTPDRLRETLFDILGPRVRGTAFLDAYAGTGAVGIEAVSRGASHAFLLESNRVALDVIRQNVAELKLETRVSVIAGPALTGLRGCQAEIAFLDPPYELESEYASALELLATSPLALVIVQHSVRFQLAGEYGRLRRTRMVKQGDNSLSFFEA